MAVKLRLMRMGKKKQPTYRVVAADSRSPRNGRFIEIIGTYEPRQDPSVVKIDNDRALHWLRHGAQPTDRVEKLLKISGAWEIHADKSEPVAASPAESMLAESMSAESTLAESMSAESAPAESMSAESAPAESIPAESAPAEGASDADASYADASYSHTDGGG